MSTIAEMRSLTDGLLRSHEQRTQDLACGRLQVQNALSNTRQVIGAYGATRRDETRVLRRTLATDAAVRRAIVSNAVTSLTCARSALASIQRATLADLTAGRRANTGLAIGALHDARAEGEARLRVGLRGQHASLTRHVSKLMSGIRRSRAVTAAQLQQSLKQGRANLESDSANFLGHLVTARSSVATAQRESLRSERATLQKEVLAELDGFRADRRALVGRLVEVSRVWREFATRRGTRHPDRRADVELLPEQGGTRPAPVMSFATEVAPPSIEESGNGHHVPADDVVFSYLADHPDGVRLVELEQRFGMARIRIAQVLSRLIEENKARKDVEAKLYFAT